MSVQTTFPGATSVTFLDVYEDAAPDGIAGGSPHVHLASTEAYVVVRGRGALQTIDARGFRETALEPGSVVWFTPGTIHRAVNLGDLGVVVVMQNDGLPEAGDAVMTFPAAHLVDSATYRASAILATRDSEEHRARDAASRRDLAVEGFLTIRDAVLAGDFGPLHDFYARATALVADRAPAWRDLVRSGPLAQAQSTLGRLDSLAAADPGLLESSGVFSSQAVRRFGMCGRISTYDVSTN